MCELPHVLAADLLSPTLTLDALPWGVCTWEIGAPRTPLGDTCYRRIETVEFALKADDWKASWLLKEADIILVGWPGKTSLSVVLSQTMGLRMTNVLLVAEWIPVAGAIGKRDGRSTKRLLLTSFVDNCSRRAAADTRRDTP
ncbi:hypothetical protein ACHAWF_017821 [Thalassiosira exigua]